jgi:hypothetical protein
MPSRVIKTDADFDALGHLLSSVKRPFTVEWRAGADRTLEQNSLMWKWAGEAAAQLGDRSADEAQREWKLTLGVPILRAENDAFRAFYDKALRGMGYHEKLAAMAFVPVTSIMTVPQMRQLMDAIQQQAADNGLRLTSPEKVR